MRIAFAEDVSRNEQQIIADRFGDKFAAAAVRRFGKSVKRPLRTNQLETILQALVDAIAFLAIVGDDGGPILIPGGDAGVLHHARRTHEGELL
jgi:hypothetical protein